MKATFKAGWPYQKDIMNLPVENLETALPFYERKMGFQLVSRSATPTRSAILSRDDLQIGLSENGGDPTQDGCFIEVDDVNAAFIEMKENGIVQERDDSFAIQKHGETTWKVFFIVTPDGLCYCLGQRQADDCREGESRFCSFV